MKHALLFIALSGLGVLSAQTKVQDVDNPGRNPVQITVSQASSAGYNSMDVYTVPIGYRFILEYAGGCLRRVRENRYGELLRQYRWQ